MVPYIKKSLIFHISKTVSCFSVNSDQVQALHRIKGFNQQHVLSVFKASLRSEYFFHCFIPRVKFSRLY